MDPMPIVDPHHHFWDLARNRYPWLQDEPPIAFRYGDYTALKTNFLPADYDRVSSAFHVVASVTVEAEWDPHDPIGETRWIDALAQRSGKPQGHIAQAWLDRDDVAEVLAAQAAFSIVRGVRHKPRTASRPDLIVTGASGSMSDPRWRNGYAFLRQHNLHFELQAPWWHAREALDLAEAFPETPLVLNHAGLPGSREPDVLAGWRSSMRLLAQAPNVSIKISGLGLPDRPWSLADNRAVINDVITIFGVDRSMFASNFPVDGLCGSFETIYDGFRAAVADYLPDDRRKLFHDNALRIYRISGRTDSSGADRAGS